MKGWKNEKALWRYLKQKPFLCTQLGFDDIPDQSTLYRAWEYRLSKVQDAVRDAAEVVVDIARYHDIPAPESEVLPDQPTDMVTNSKTKDTLAREKAREVWKGAKPIVEDCFHLDRASNASIPEGAFWEQQAYLGMRSDMHPHDGAGNFAEESTRRKTPSGDSHRLQTKTLGVERIRTMLRETGRTLVARAKSKDKPDHRFRYSNFAFACVLYNCWRLVDILVQLELHGEVGDKPAVSSNSFLTFAKKNYGLDPPD